MAPFADPTPPNDAMGERIKRVEAERDAAIYHVPMGQLARPLSEAMPLAWRLDRWHPDIAVLRAEDVKRLASAGLPVTGPRDRRGA